MAAILQRQPLTIKQQVEELKNWHKQQQSKLDPKVLGKGSVSKSNKENEKEGNFINISGDSNSKVNFDEIPIKVTNSNFNTFMKDNVSSVNSHISGEIVGPGEKGNKPKFRFLKKGEGIARFNMGPPKISKRIIPRKQGLSLKLSKDPKKLVSVDKKQDDGDVLKSVNMDKVEQIPTLEVPDVKLNFRTWKSILSGENPEDLLEKAINNNQLDLWDHNSSVDSSTFSLMEKILALGKNKLSKDREELRVFEAIEQHMLDSSFCSTSSYVTRLMENAMVSTPNKETYNNQPRTTVLKSNPSDQRSKAVIDEYEVSSHQGVVAQTMPGPSYSSLQQNHEQLNKISLGSNQNSITNNSGEKSSQPVASWIKPDTIKNQSRNTLAEESIEDTEESVHVRFAEHVDYKSFIEQSQSIEDVSQREGNENEEFDESSEWKEDSEDSSSCCSQCSRHSSLNEDVRPLNSRVSQPQSNHLHSEKTIPIEKLNIVDLKTNNTLPKNDPSSEGDLNNFPPVMMDKLRELEDEIKIFREENSNIKSLRESLEKEYKRIQEEKRHLQLEKKKIQKDAEEERKRLTTQLEEEKQKLAKEKTVFEKYSKSLTKNPSREERKELQVLRDQLVEMKEELNKKESRWGAAQARVRNQVKVLEEDNRKLREEIEKFRKQSKYWELFNQKKKGKPFNNTRLIHAISEHISNIVLDDEIGLEENSGKAGYFSQNSSAPKTSSIDQTDIKSMYSVKVIKENNNKSTLPSGKVTSKSNADSEKSFKKVPSDISTENCRPNGVINTLSESKGTGAIRDLSVSATERNPDERNLQSEDRCQKPELEVKSSDAIKEVVDQNGNVEVVFPNGNIKKINKITGSEKYIYINGDVEEITHDGTVKYYYSKSRIWQTTLPDGLEIVDFADGKVEKRHVDGTKEIIYSNNNKKYSYPDGSQEIMYTDGTRLKIEVDKTQILTLPNGQKEIHTEEWKRREYPDGTMKTLYPDGTTETVYSNGRVRLKDKYGNLVMDSASNVR